jgi:hypothetical protein
LLVLLVVSLLAGPVQTTTPAQVVDPIARAFTGRTRGEIPRRLGRGTGDVDLPDSANPGERVFAPGPLGRLTNTACRSDLTATGAFVGVTSHLSEDAGTLYSEWRFAVAEPLKRRGLAAGVVPGATISVYMRGGSKTFDGRTVRVANRDFRTGVEAGAEFLLFARRIPETDALLATAGFRFDGERVSRASDQPLYPALEAMTRPALLSTVREVLDRTASNPDCAGPG